MANVRSIIMAAMLAFTAKAQPFTQSELGWFLNQAPVARDKVMFTIQNASIATTLYGRDSKTPVSFSIGQSPTNGLLSGLNTSTGDVTYSPTTDFTGADFFSFSVSDGRKSAIGNVRVLVVSNTVPSTNCISFTVSSQPVEACGSGSSGSVCVPGECISWFGNSNFCLTASSSGNACFYLTNALSCLSNCILSSASVSGSGDSGVNGNYGFNSFSGTTLISILTNANGQFRLTFSGGSKYVINFTNGLTAYQSTSTFTYCNSNAVTAFDIVNGWTNPAPTSMNPTIGSVLVQSNTFPFGFCN